MPCWVPQLEPAVYVTMKHAGIVKDEQQKQAQRVSGE